MSRGMRKYSTVRARAFDIDEALRIKGLGVNDGTVDVGENFEFASAADVVAVAGGAVGDDFAPAFVVADEAGFVRVNHAVLFGHLFDPAVVFDAHGVSGLG